MFKIGDLAVSPAHGVGVIERVESKEISGCRQDFYVMRILDNDMIIMIPTGNVINVGLREIIDRNEVPKLYSILKKRDVVIDNQTWNRRGPSSRWLKSIGIYSSSNWKRIFPLVRERCWILPGTYW